jgi:hypothetical protein
MTSRWKIKNFAFVVAFIACFFLVIVADDQSFSDNNCPESTHFQCRDGKTCIKQKYVCNNETDCPDKDDESDCG